MYIDSMTVTAFIVFAIAMVVFVKKCFINSCIINEDDEAGDSRDAKSGGEQ